MEEPNLNVVYTHISSVDSKVFYVGSGKKHRPYVTNTRTKSWNEVAKKGYTVMILAKDLNKKDSLELERLIIESYGYENLVNQHQYKNKRACKKIIDTSTGLVYNETKDVCDAFSIKYTTLSKKLSGDLKNNTTFKYLQL